MLFLYFPFPPVFYVDSCACKRSLKLKRSEATPTEAPRSHKKMLLKRLVSCPAFDSCDFVTSHCLTISHFCTIYEEQLFWHVRTDLTQLLWCWVSHV